VTHLDQNPANTNKLKWPCVELEKTETEKTKKVVYSSEIETEI